MREMDVLSGMETTGKGGRRWVYYPKLDEKGFKDYLVDKVIMSLMSSFPEETREVIKHLNG